MLKCLLKALLLCLSLVWLAPLDGLAVEQKPAKSKSSKSSGSAKSAKKSKSGKSKHESAEDGSSDVQVVLGLNLKNGFRGVAWGTPLEKSGSLMLKDDGGIEKAYARKKENLRINQAEAKEIIYVYCNGKLAGGMVLFQGIANFNRLKEEVKATFGDQTMADLLSSRYEWNSEKSLVLMEYNQRDDAGGLACYYEPFYRDCAVLHYNNP